MICCIVSGDEKIYNSLDEGDTERIGGEKEIHIKIGCPVILTVNLSDELVNGLSGTVEKMNNDNVHVYFPTIDRNVALEPLPIHLRSIPFSRK